MDNDLNTKTTSIKLLKENVGENLHTLGKGKGFLNRTEKQNELPTVAFLEACKEV